MFLATIVATSFCLQPTPDTQFQGLKPLPPRIEFPAPHTMIDWDFYIRVNEEILSNMKSRKVPQELIDQMQRNQDKCKELKLKYAPPKAEEQQPAPLHNMVSPRRAVLLSPKAADLK